MKKEIKLIYIGERFTGQTMCSTFIREGVSDAEDNQLNFKSGDKYVIGTKYLAEEESETKKIQLFSKSLVVGEKFDNEVCLKKWRLESKAATVFNKEMNARSRVDKNPLPKKLIEELRTEVSGLSHKDATAFFDYLVNEVLFKPMQEAMNKRMNDIVLKSHITRLKKTQRSKK